MKPTTPIDQLTLEAAFASLCACDRGQQIAADLAPIFRSACYLDLHYRKALVVIFTALHENSLNGSICDLSRNELERNQA